MKKSYEGDDETLISVSVEMHQMFAKLKLLYPPELGGHSMALDQIESALWKELNIIDASSSQPSRGSSLAKQHN